MKSINELLSDDSAWVIIEQWISKANKPIEILEVNKSRAEKELVNLQITTKSPLGAIAYKTGGILFDNRWLRFLGAGNDNMERSLSSWNKMDINSKCTRLDGAMLIADDILGGFFALNGGAFEGKLGDVYYLAPETLKWESLNMPYTNFLNWAFTGDVFQFYKTFRWEKWEKEVSSISGDQCMLFYPFLWTKEDSVEKRSKSIVPIEEIWNLTIQNSSIL
ncbi:hypothetical protein CLHUN_42690 [Ruminiclostridium hungatei]|uniref:DUF2625 domain-containing protein n=1 Tax=Ruminiclostridium hungatei TaxID=48256 RepID=A0A1V4SD71_RUMHU|nr:DUF2625 domain-containing protein [Ruminiclostridium hungatei]OPX41862.1 hypothetical protein CLHUN_42690 [Ruminiclostridium hungatei]